MSRDFLLDGLPLLKLDDIDYLLYSPYTKLLAKAPLSVFNNNITKDYLRSRGFFNCPKADKTINQSIKVVLNITNRCNLSCRYCWANTPKSLFDEISPSLATNIFANLTKSKKIERIHFMGGEPTLNFETIKTVVKYFGNSHVDPLPVFYITTNGVIPKEKLKWLINNKFAFSISWDGLGLAHNVHRPHFSGGGSEARVRSTILEVAETELPLRVRMTISKLNLPCLYESVSWLADHNVRFVHIEAVSPTGTHSDFAGRHTPSPKEFVDELLHVVKLAERKNIWILNSSMANLYSPRDYYCSSLKGPVYNFNPDGSISHCFKVQGVSDKLANNFIVGRYQNENGCIEIDENKSHDLSSITVSRYPEFENDSLRNFYSGGCPYRNFIASGSWTGTDQDMHRMSQLLLRRAILHVYERALRSNNSAFEGYIRFYRLLTHNNGQSNNHNHNHKKTANLATTNFSEKLYSVEFIPIPLTCDQHVAIDACDICI